MMVSRDRESAPRRNPGVPSESTASALGELALPLTSGVTWHISELLDIPHACLCIAKR